MTGLVSVLDLDSTSPIDQSGPSRDGVEARSRLALVFDSDQSYIIDTSYLGLLYWREGLVNTGPRRGQAESRTRYTETEAWQCRGRGVPYPVYPARVHLCTTPRTPRWLRRTSDHSSTDMPSRQGRAGPPSQTQPTGFVWSFVIWTPVSTSPRLGPYSHPDNQPRVTPWIGPWLILTETSRRRVWVPLYVPDQPY